MTLRPRRGLLRYYIAKRSMWAVARHLDLQTLEGEAHLNGASLYIVMSLASGDKHGHALMRDIERFAGVRLGPGTLYKAIGRLEDAGLIRALAADDRRRPYALTAEGRATLERSVAYHERILSEGRRRLASAWALRPAH